MPCRPNAWRWCFRFLHSYVSNHVQAGGCGCTGWISDHPEKPGGNLYDTVPDPGSKQRAASCRHGFKAGRIAGRLMGEFLRGQGEVAVFTSDGDDHQSFPFGTREGGFREIMEQNYPDMEILNSIQTKEQTQIIRRGSICIRRYGYCYKRVCRWLLR